MICCEAQEQQHRNERQVSLGDEEPQIVQGNEGCVLGAHTPQHVCVVVMHQLGVGEAAYPLLKSGAAVNRVTVGKGQQTTRASPLSAAICLRYLFTHRHLFQPTFRPDAAPKACWYVSAIASLHNYRISHG